MRKITLALLAAIWTGGPAYAEPRTESGTVSGLFDMDDQVDSLTYRYDYDPDDSMDGQSESGETKTPVTLEISLAGASESKKTIVKTHVYAGHSFFVRPGKKGEIILAHGGERRFETYQYYYSYNRKLNDWFLTKTEYGDHLVAYDPYAFVYDFDYYPGVTGIDGKTIDQSLGEAETGAERLARMRQKLASLYDELMSLYKAKRLDSGPGCPDDLEEIMENIPVTSENVEMYNNLGFFLPRECSGYVLNQVIAAVPERTPAHLNLADVYHEIGLTREAADAYARYVELMKNEGRAKKIPRRVWERLEQGNSED